MNTVVERKFQALGARVKISEAKDTTWRVSRPFSIDIKRDKEGEFFDIQAKEEVEMLVLDAQKNDRHLLLLVKDHSLKEKRDQATGELKMYKPVDPDKFRFLCGHDERNWFTCAVPGGASSVFQAKQALKPVILREIETKEGVKASQVHKRHRKLKSGRKIHRQGEFMFIPEPNYQPPKGFTAIIHRHEPMSRGDRRTGGNPHTAEYLYREGGTQVYVSRVAPNGLTVKEHTDWVKNNPDRKEIRWDYRVRDPQVWVKGKITHREHKTLDLGEMWHQCVLNRENEAPGARNVSFID
jgi:hypothetical protein